MAGDKKTTTTPKGESMLALVMKALSAIRSSKKGVSRQAIANWILENSKKNAGAAFNGWLRRALATGLEKNLLKRGETTQRYKLGDAAKSFGKVAKKKKVVKKKVVSKKKKKTTTKKKKTTTKKKSKKTASKKKSTKKTTPKRKTSSKKKKTTTRGKK